MDVYTANEFDNNNATFVLQAFDQYGSGIALDDSVSSAVFYEGRELKVFFIACYPCVHVQVVLPEVALRIC